MDESYGIYVDDEYFDNHDYDDADDDTDDDTDDDNDHKKDSYTAAGAAPTQTWPDSGEQKKIYNNNFGRFPGGGLENQNPARTIAHSPPDAKRKLDHE